MLALACGISACGDPPSGSAVGSEDGASGTEVSTSSSTGSATTIAGLGGACVYHEDCEAGLACIDATCEPWECYGASDCPADHVCIDATCVPTECREDHDCDDGRACTADRQCVGAILLPACEDLPALNHRVLFSAGSSLGGVTPLVSGGRVEGLVTWVSDATAVQLVEDLDANEPVISTIEVVADSIRFAFVDDRDGDGQRDALALGNHWMLSTSAASPGTLDVASPLPHPEPCAALREDLDLDGVLDLLVVSPAGGWVVTFDSDGEVAASSLQGGTTSSRCRLARGQLDADGELDFAWLGVTYLHRRHADGSDGSSSLASGYSDFALVDLDDDGVDSILLYGGPEHPRLRVHQEELPLYASPLPLNRLVTVDMNLDGRPDVVGTSDGGVLQAFMVGESGLRCVASSALELVPISLQVVHGTDRPTLLATDAEGMVVLIEVGR